MTRVLIVLGAGLALGLIAGQGCKYSELDPSHCANNDGDAHCAASFPDGSRPFCERGTAECVSDDSDRGCVAVRPLDACYSPCGGRSTIDEHGECRLEASSSSGTGEPADPGSTSESSHTSTGVEPGPTSDGGTTTAGPPSCPEDQSACVPCSEHAQCESGACELALERCFSPAVVVHVDGDGAADHSTLAAALLTIEDGGYGVVVVHELDGGAPYEQAGALRVNGGKTVALLAAPGEQPVIRGTSGAPGLRVEGAETSVYVDGLRLEGNPVGRGLLVDGALAWVDRSRVVHNAGGGVLARDGATLVLRNGFVGSEHGGVGLEIVEASATVLYSTITTQTLASTPALGCFMPVEVDVRNSIIVSQGGTSPDELSCFPAAVTDSATEADVGDFDEGWFVDFEGGDLSLTLWGSLAFMDVARWRTGDPATDIDGDLRPTIDGAPDHAGADRP